MKKIFTLVSFCLAVMASSAQSVVDYEIRTLTFEDANYASDEPNFAHRFPPIWWYNALWRRRCWRE